MQQGAIGLAHRALVKIWELLRWRSLPKLGSLAAQLSQEVNRALIVGVKSIHPRDVCDAIAQPLGVGIGGRGGGNGKGHRAAEFGFSAQ